MKNKTKKWPTLMKCLPFQEHSYRVKFKISELSDGFDWTMGGKFRRNKKFQRNYGPTDAWASQWIVSCINGSVEFFPNVYFHNSSPVNQTNPPLDIVDGLHRIGTFRCWIKGRPYPLGHKLHGTDKMKYLKLSKGSEIRLPSGYKFDASGLTHEDIKEFLAEKDAANNNQTRLLGEYLDRFEQSVNCVVYWGLNDKQVYQLFLDINQTNRMTRQQLRNACGSDASEAAKQITMKDYSGDETYKFHPLYELKDNRLGLFSFTLKGEKIQEFLLRNAYVLHNWNTPEFDYGDTALDDMTIHGSDVNGDFQKNYPKLKAWCDFLYNAATQGVTSSTDNQVLFNVEGEGRRAVDFMMVIWDCVLHNHTVLSGDTILKYTLTDDRKEIINEKTIYHFSNRSFYNWIKEKYDKLCEDGPKKGAYGGGETEFRTVVRKNTLCYSEWTCKLKKWIDGEEKIVDGGKVVTTGILQELDAMTDDQLLKIGLIKTDAKDPRFTKKQRVEAWWKNPVSLKDGKILAISQSEADHIIPKSRPGMNLGGDDNLQLEIPSINRAKGDKLEGE